MKRMKVLVIALLAFTAANTNTATAQVVEEGNVLIDTYYGFPNLYTATFKSLYANSGIEQNVEIGGIGPVGLRVEYLLTDKIGLGVDLGFNNTNLTFEETTTDSEGDPVTYQYDYNTQKFGVMVTFNYHFIENDNLDFYGVLGAGYGNRTFTFDSNNPNDTELDVKSIIPIASRLGIGLRYFFTDNIGANLGVGFGQGGILNAGLSFKF